MSSPLASLTKDIMASDVTRNLAVRGIKQKVDWIFGYSKYNLEEISGELRYRLHCMEYLGVAVNAILGSEIVDDATKTRLATNYLRTLPLYVEGSLPKDVYETWAEMEPTCVAEAAAFLAERGLFEWDDHELIKCVLGFASKSDVKVKADFLSRLVGRLNRDGRLLSDLSKRGLWHDDMAEELQELSGKGRDPYGLDSMSEAGRRLLVNLRPLFDAGTSGSSIGQVADLRALTDQDLVEFFLGVGGLFFLNGRMNRVVLFKDLAEAALRRRGIEPPDLLVKLDQGTDRDRFFYDDEVKAKALLKLAQESGKATKDFVAIIQKFLDYRMETDTRFQFLRFVYENSRDAGILDKAMRFKSSKIRRWATEERGKLPVT